MLKSVCVAAVMLLIAGCGSGDLTLDQADPNAVPEQPTWDQVYSIFQRECAPCHTDDESEDTSAFTPGGASASPGGVGPDFSTCIGIIENLDDAMTSIFDKNNMPPGAWPRLTSEERLIIQRWREQGEDAPCR